MDTSFVWNNLVLVFCVYENRAVASAARTYSINNNALITRKNFTLNKSNVTEGLLLRDSAGIYNSHSIINMSPALKASDNRIWGISTKKRQLKKAVVYLFMALYCFIIFKKYNFSSSFRVARLWTICSEITSVPMLTVSLKR